MSKYSYNILGFKIFKSKHLIMLLNDNIKGIIHKYLTYSDEQIQEFRLIWQDSIYKTNRLFNIGINDYRRECYICLESGHCNHECTQFYHHLHIINSIIQK